MSIAFYNGDFCSLEEVRIPLSDRCIFFGDGIYDAAVGRNGNIYLKDEHIERFFENAKRTEIKCQYKKSELSRLLDEAVDKGEEECFFIYFQLSRYSEVRRHAYEKNCASNLLITVTPQELSYCDKRLKLVTREDLRYQYCNIKTLNLLPSVLASGYAEAKGADEAVFHRKDIVTECAHSNISIITKGALKTHPNGPLILPGIARKKLIEKCDELNIPIEISPFSLEELYSADEVIVTSSSKICLLCESVNSVHYKHQKNSIGMRLKNALWADFLKATEK